MLGYEFLGISLLLIYSSGIAIIFIITSMIVGTKHISLLFKSNSTTNDRSIPTTEEVTLNFLYIAFFILIFLTINFSGDFRDSIYQLLVQNSLSNFLTFNSLALLNDTFILGFLIYNQYATHTIVSGFVLLISLISSIYISQVK
jgi:NADH:ubiquinone oxidoreductase subunit 6 (subunit J)